MDTRKNPSFLKKKGKTIKIIIVRAVVVVIIRRPISGFTGAMFDCRPCSNSYLGLVDYTKDWYFYTPVTLRTLYERVSNVRFGT